MAVSWIEKVFHLVRSFPVLWLADAWTRCGMVAEAFERRRQEFTRLRPDAAAGNGIQILALPSPKS